MTNANSFHFLAKYEELRHHESNEKLCLDAIEVARRMKHVLIIKLGGIGDLLLSTPALKALRDLYPEAEISILVPSRVYGVVKSLSYIDRVFTFNLEYGKVFPFSKRLRNLKILFILRKKRFDVAINMRTLVSDRSAKKMKILLDIIRPGMKVGRDTEGRGYFFDIKIPETDIGTKSETEYDIETVKALGADTIDRTIDFEIDQESIESVDRIMERECTSKDVILIGVHPGGMPSRRWPIENFVKLAEDLPKRMPCKLVATGGESEISLIKELVRASRSEVINLAGKLSIMELGALIRRCNLFLSNDTGPIHMAAIIGTPLVAIFGPGDIAHYDPRNISQRVVVLYEKADCAPCDKIECETMKCLKKIHPEDVIEAALGLVGYNNHRR